MGVKTKTVKRAARQIVEKHYTRLVKDFQVNKRICDEVAFIPTKRLRNLIAGYVTRLMKRIEKGPVRGISLQLQEEERERKENYIPVISALEKEVEIDEETARMLKGLGMPELKGIYLHR
uniref:40S ribosomal protein S17 n=1 Tax=Metchnikovella dogieli TaxID=2804710 RepID=A0A896WLA9_9MICR|nr:40S ribosomal protein S17 [Metchnikovella dogieli]